MEMVISFFHAKRRPLECPSEGTKWTKNLFILFPSGLEMMSDLILVSHRKMIFGLCLLRMKLRLGRKEFWPLPR